MAEHKTIPRRQPDPEGLDFDGLKAVGIEALQSLCGATWTDYNLHDPGITVLEQLCYALTEVKYRAGFDVADYLAGPDGSIDFERHALYRPQDILPSQAVTLADYRKLIIDGVPGIDNVWLRTQDPSGAGMTGLYSAYVRQSDAVSAGLPGSDTDWVVQQVRKVYANNRNLCEDLHEVRIVAQRRYSLHGRIELDGDRSPAEILAQIYYLSGRLVARGIEFFPYEELMARGVSLEQLFSGPLTAHGYIDEARLGQSEGTVSCVDLFGLIGRIEGVKYVDQLEFQDELGSRVDTLRVDDFLTGVPYLVYPATDEAIGVRLYKNGRPHLVSFVAFSSELDRLRAERRSVKRGAADLETLSALPVGVPMAFAEYHSIQNDFPEVYGINAYGLPQSASRERKAQAKQFKAYLLFFEQILANALENLQQAGRLFSLDATLEQTYFSQTLNADCVPDSEALYDVAGYERNKRVADVLATYDDYGDRRNRVLDYLLGLHGEAFSQRSLRHFDHYLAGGDVEAELIRNKLGLLESLVPLSQRRAGAFDYLEAADGEGNRAMLARKIEILLGMRVARGGYSSSALHDRGLRLVEDSAMQWEYASDTTESRETAGWPRERPASERISGKINDDRLFRDVSFLKEGKVSIPALRYGIHLDHYRVTPGTAACDVLLRHGEDSAWCRVATCPTFGEAEVLARDLRDFLIQLNAQCERMLLVEHLLLRPRAARQHGIKVPDGFYPFRLSVVFPAWTARCGDEKFRHLAEETVALNCPAHIHAECHWLDFEDMGEFERRHAAWLAALRGAEADVIDVASEAMTAFLLGLGESGR